MKSCDNQKQNTLHSQQVIDIQNMQLCCMITGIICILKNMLEYFQVYTYCRLTCSAFCLELYIAHVQNDDHKCFSYKYWCRSKTRKYSSQFGAGQSYSNKKKTFTNSSQINQVFNAIGKRPVRMLP